MSRIRLSDNTLIDTDEVVFSSKRDDDTRQGVILGSWIPQTFVILRGGCQQILTGEEKAVFDAWAEGPKGKGMLDDALSVCQPCCWLVSSPLGCRNVGEDMCRAERLTAMAYKQGVRAGREEMDEFYSKRAIPSCQTCVYHDWKISPCEAPIGAETFPDCHKERPGPSGTADGETMEAFVAWARGERQAEAAEACWEVEPAAHTHMHSSSGGGGAPHEHLHVIGDHHGAEEARYPNEKRYSRSDTQ